ncbi:MAG: hypothetical protein WC043_10335 [Pseudobdellovibrionaceae bacterium]
MDIKSVITSPSYVAALRASRTELGAGTTQKASTTTSTTSSLIQAGDFSVTTPLDDYLPQSRPSTKKQFKDNKDYIAYMLLLFMKMGKITPPEGRQFVRLEDRHMLQRLEKELSSLVPPE